MEVDFRIYLQNSDYNKQQIVAVLKQAGFDIVLGSSNEFISPKPEFRNDNLNYYLGNQQHISFVTEAGTIASKYYGLEGTIPSIGFYTYQQYISLSFEVTNFKDIDFEGVFDKAIKVIHLLPDNFVFALMITLNYEFVILTKSEGDFMLFKDRDYGAYKNNDTEYNYFLRRFLEVLAIFRKTFFALFGVITKQ